MALTQIDLDNIDAAIATGELKVEYNGRMVIYRSIPELKEARAHVATVLAGQTQSTTPRRGNYRVNFITARGD